MIVAAVFIAIASAQGIAALRYDDALFAEAYQQKYDSPRAALDGLEQVFRTGDRTLLKELEGTRRARPLLMTSDLFGAVMWSREHNLYSYMYWDADTFDRYLFHLDEIGGRWVVVPEDAYFFLRTGLWQATWLPIALVYWLAEIAALFVIGLARMSRRWQRNRLAF